MEHNIRTAIRNYRRDRLDADFLIVYNYCFPDFRYWYRNTQRYTDLDRQTLLSEFQYVVLRTVRRFDVSSPVPDGFIRYFRAAAKKRSLTLRRISSSQRQYSLKTDWDVVDVKGGEDINAIDTSDVIDTCFVGQERAIILNRMSGELSDNVRRQLGMSEFKYRSALKNIKNTMVLKLAV